MGFILLGRDDVEWPSYEHSPVRDWQAVIDAQRLGELSDPEVASILAAVPVPDPDVAAAISEGAAGLPFYLGLQLDIHRDLVGEGVTPTPEHFARAPKAVLARFASHLGERLATAFTTLAHARRFDEALFAHLKTRPGTLVGPVGLAEISRYSLIEGDPDGFLRLHQHFQDLQRDELARTRPDDQRRIDDALFAYWEARCQPPNPRSLHAGHDTALREAAYHQRLLAPTEHANWLASRWWPFAEAARLQLCLDLWQRALATAEQANRSESTATAAALGNLGIVLQDLGRLDDARAAQERALGIEEKVYGPEHHQVAITLGNLGVLLKRLDDLPAALAAEERALGIFERRLPPTHPYIVQACENLADTLERLGEAGRAAELRARAAAMRGGGD
jgi:tetratricopeptide (TPR) repeat protein